MKVSLLIATFMRDHLLELTIPTIISQEVDFDLEVIVINDGYPGTTEQLCNHFDVNYLFTGQRNLKKPRWRIPGFAFNIAVKACTGDIIILSCAEMYHLNYGGSSILQVLVDPVIQNLLAIGQAFGKEDDGTILTKLRKKEILDLEAYYILPDFNSALPFLFSVSKKAYFDIGGYDEDFIGTAFDDDDFVERLVSYGCQYIPTTARAIHLHHPIAMPEYGRVSGNSERWLYNRRLYKERKGIMVRNINREWGKMDES